MRSYREDAIGADSASSTTCKNLGSEVLQFAIENGIINVAQVCVDIEMKKREERLSKHQYAITQSADGKWYTKIKLKDGSRKTICRSSKEKVEDEVIRYIMTEEDNPTVKDMFEEWNNRQLELKKITAPTHSRNVCFFNRHFQTAGEWRISSVSKDEWIDFLERQVPEFNLSAKAFSGLKTVLRGTLKLARKKKYIGFNVEEIFQELDVSDREFSRKVKDPEETVFNEEEMDKIIAYVKEHMDDLNSSKVSVRREQMKNVIIALMFVTGMRCGEAAALKADVIAEDYLVVRRTEIHWKNENNRYVTSVKEFAKTEKGVRTIVVPPSYQWILKVVQELPRTTDWAFEQNGKRITEYMIYKRLKTLCSVLGIVYKSTHKIRATYATILLDAKVDNRFICDQMGHVDIRVTEENYHRNRKTLERKMEILNGIPEFVA